jgi:hypothetical protein
MVPDMYLAKGAVADDRRGRYEAMTQGFDGSDATRIAHHAKINRLAALFIPVYALVFTLVAFDGIMALQPHWFSNLLGGWYFMGSFLGAHTGLVLLMLYGRGQLGIADLVSPKQRHDLGKLCFGFSVFWTYLMWAQFQVIWYANLPEETGFVFARLWGPWIPVAKAVLSGMFFIPFAVLLGVAPKKSRLILGTIACVSLTALFLERYLMVMPSVSEENGPVFGMPELGPTALFFGLFLATYALWARTYPMISPRLAEITLDREVHHHETEVYDHEDTDKDFVHEGDLDK